VPSSSLLEALERMGPGPRGRREVGRVLPVASEVVAADAADRRRRDDWNAFLVALSLLALALLVVGLSLGAGDRVDANGKALDRADGILTDVRVRLDAMEEGMRGKDTGYGIRDTGFSQRHGGTEGFEAVKEADALFGRGEPETWNLKPETSSSSSGAVRIVPLGGTL
jgi:hypothetical protein